MPRKMVYSSKHLPVQLEQQKHQKKAWNMFKVNNEDFETDINDLIVSFEHISHLFLVFLLLTLNW